MHKKPSFLKRTWSFLLRPCLKYSVLAVASVSILVGIIFWGGFNTAMEATNDMEFCISCHEMRDNVYQEYKKTIHYSNRIGVRATCSDCHVPKHWGYKVLRKIEASRELIGKVTGVVDTVEKFESHRMKLATREWARLKASDSRECRNCHSFDAMRKSVSNQLAYAKHIKAQEEGGTCIDCHRGIAHLLPLEYEE